MRGEKFLNDLEGLHQSGYPGEDSMRAKAERLMRDQMMGTMEFPKSASAPDRMKMRLYKKGGHVKKYADGGRVAEHEHEGEMMPRLSRHKKAHDAEHGLLHDEFFPSKFRHGGHARKKAAVTSEHRKAMKGRTKSKEDHLARNFIPEDFYEGVVHTPKLNVESLREGARMKKGGSAHNMHSDGHHPAFNEFGKHGQVYHNRKGGKVHKAAGGSMYKKGGHAHHAHKHHHKMAEGGHMKKINYEAEMMGTKHHKSHPNYESEMMGEKCLAKASKTVGKNPHHPHKEPFDASHGTVFRKGGRVHKAAGGAAKVRKGVASPAGNQISKRVVKGR